jgi:hypothetical protein
LLFVFAVRRLGAKKLVLPKKTLKPPHYDATRQRCSSSSSSELSPARRSRRLECLFAFLLFVFHFGTTAMEKKDESERE